MFMRCVNIIHKYTLLEFLSEERNAQNQYSSIKRSINVLDIWIGNKEMPPMLDI